MKNPQNPFGRPSNRPEPEEQNPAHPSDDPGYEISTAGQDEKNKHPHSGAGGPSQPRRPGTGERQAQRRSAEERISAYEPVVPGEVLYQEEPVEINAGAEVTVLRVENTADRPVQVGSHYHFAEVNAGLTFDRKAAWGKRLNVLAGGSMRFEPGAAEEVELIPIGGKRIVLGLRGLCGGKLDD
ncbi:urease subunit beta [Paenarthrobacter sp. PH39-S1]|uniref:urease subunit beta n=1 Tax=Paenarthrobacter sp. PH39-S1 TaxID=3046204 RepID=UPI0024B957F7|nr:urease subunit beta [Paenarthrobacter sp. PH39-S1]MDJ0355234.1 urease subunit beta [Paenarthrobacter sp. PH39-S1]